MENLDGVEQHFENYRGHLKDVAYRMLGSTAEADDAVQEAWLRLTRSEPSHIKNLKGWLTTVVARVCLDMLRARKSKREEPLEDQIQHVARSTSGDAEAELILANAVGQALLVVLDLLKPAERIAFVLHDLFDLTFEEIAPIIDRTPEASRKLASRARQRVKGADARSVGDDRHKEVVTAFFAATREGNFAVLLKLLHPDVVLRADQTAIKVAEANKAKGAPQFKEETKGAKSVAQTFNGKAAAAQIALVNGQPGATWTPGGKPVVAFCFTIKDGQITAIDVVMNPDDLSHLDIRVI